MESRPPLPPFTRDAAVAKVRGAEDGWNTRDPQRVALAYTPDSRWRNRSEFFAGSPAIVAFLTRKWARELDYRLIKEMWAFDADRIAVRFAYEWHDRRRRVVPLLRQRELAVRRERPDGAAAREHQRRPDRRGRPEVPLGPQRASSARPPGPQRPGSLSATSGRPDSAYVVRSRPGSPSIVLDDGGAAPPAGPAPAAVHPEVAASCQIAGGRLDRAMPVEVEHLVGPADHARQVRHVADRGLGRHARDEAELVGVHVPDPGQPGLVEQCLLDRCGRAAPGGGGRPRRRPSRGRAGRGRGDRRCPARGRGPRSPRCRAGNRRPRCRRSRARPGPCVPGSRPRLTGLEDPPAALHLEVGVQGPPLVGVDAG